MVPAGSYVPNQFSYAFACEGKHAGLIRVDPLGDPRPPYCITYNKVRLLGLESPAAVPRTYSPGIHRCPGMNRTRAAVDKHENQFKPSAFKGRVPFPVHLLQVVNGCRFLTVGDEEGSVSIVDTRAEQLPSSLYTDHATPPRARWLAHNNTIFDMAWAKVTVLPSAAEEFLLSATS